MATVEKRLSALEKTVNAMYELMQRGAQATPVVAAMPSEPAHDTSPPPPLPYDWYREPRVLSGHPNTVTMPKTGHVLSVPAPENGENIGGYMIRVSWQAHGDVGTLGSVMGLGPSAVLGPWGYRHEDPDTWPYATDRYFNQWAYMTPEEAQAARDQMAQWPTQPPN